MHKKLIQQASKEFGVERKLIRNWTKNLSELIATENKPKMFTIYLGKRIETGNIETEIIKWIVINRSLCSTVSLWEVIINVYNLKEDLNKKC